MSRENVSGGRDDRPAGHPCCRASVREGRVTLNEWSPSLLGQGPAVSGLADVAGALADLQLIDRAELMVSPVHRVTWSKRAERTLLAWAHAVGYRRVWLPDRIAEFDEPPPFGQAETSCPTCGARWEDGSTAFWEVVLSAGSFPSTCMACGGGLPQWTLRRGKGSPSAGVSEPSELERSVRRGQA